MIKNDLRFEALQKAVNLHGPNLLDIQFYLIKPYVDPNPKYLKLLDQIGFLKPVKGQVC